MNRDITISELPATTVVDDNSYIPIDNGDITYRIKVSDYNAGANVTARAYAEAAGTHASAAAESASSAAEASELCLRRVEITESNVRTASDKANEAQVHANTAYEYAAAASTSASNATSQAQQVSDYAREAGEKSEDAEAYAVGQRKGVDVTSEDETFENNAKYYKEQASAEVARISDLTANVSSDALKAEGYAVGTQDGSPVLSEYSQNNAKYYAENAASSAHIARVSKDTAVQYAKKAESAVVKAPYIGANNHWYVYNFDQEEYIDTNVGATGAPGQQGDPGTNGITPTITATASVDNTSGTPSVSVTKTGTNTNPSFAFAFSGLKGQPGDGSGTSYDDTEIKSKINDIWKAQGELGAKNLLVYPYKNASAIRNNVQFTVNDDTSVTVYSENPPSAWTQFHFMNKVLKAGDYTISCNTPLSRGIQIQVYRNSGGAAIASLSSSTMSETFTVTPEMEQNDSIKIFINLNPNYTYNQTVYLMLRHAEDTISTWQPYANTNYELTKKVDFLESQLPNTSIIDIVCWGDSLTKNGGWTDELATLSGLPVFNAGTGGENSKCIMARQGGDVMIVDNITIPATTTTVTIASRASDNGISTQLGNKVMPLLQGGAHVNPVTIGDVTGTLAWTGSNYADQNGTWTFKRSTAGDEVVIDRPTAIRTNFDIVHNNKNELMIIFMGTNGGYANDNDLINQHKLMIDHFKGKEYIVLGFSYGDSQSQVGYEAAMKEAFGRRFISLREYLAHPIYENGEIVSCYGLADQNLTPTADDLEKIVIGQVPSPCFTDGTHYTEGTKAVIGKMLYRKLKELNIL